MLSPAHVLEIAVLLLLAFVVGASVGTIARLAALRLAPPRVARPVEAVAAPAPTADAAPTLVSAPVIAPVSKPATPAAPADLVAPDFSEAIQSIAASRPDSIAPMPEITIPAIAPLPVVEIAKRVAEIAPARVAGETTSGQRVPHPQTVPQPSPSAVPPSGITAEVIPFPTEKAPEAPAKEEASVEPESLLSASEQAIPVEHTDAAAPDADMPMAVEPAPDPHPQPPAAEEPQSEPESEVEAVAVPAAPPPEPAIETLIAAPAGSASEDDEAAAMRAIEGNWTPRRRAPGRARKAALPDGIATDEAIVAAGVAVASAVEAVELVVAEQPESPPGKPVGIEPPQPGGADNLTNVIGILPIIETALNSLGVYHFDQIADFSDENIDWVEQHLGIAGRIRREHWREQARELAAAIAKSKKVAGKQ
ncbi:MAG: hypothetical protein JWQ89_4526 [Devosia sp.]|uniref:hypothetical protein n=1 Tax=Devosia sp. TaxID=1871048 RepID=UPI002621C28F|nr:hypothetical protein [Devosia sp.]MDB5542799.1 hypothetical protein [Devosia sp.]